jgi:hypothetical protein
VVVVVVEVVVVVVVVVVVFVVGSNGSSTVHKAVCRLPMGKYNEVMNRHTTRSYEQTHCTWKYTTRCTCSHLSLSLSSAHI